MIGDAWFQSFLSALVADDDAVATWSEWENDPWTKTITRCSAEATKAVLAELGVAEAQVAAKEHPDIYERSEYLTLDCLGYDNEDWGPPRVVVELENTAKKIQYCAWKLLCVEADLRVLVCYVGDGKGRPKDVATACALLREVVGAHRGRSLGIVFGDSRIAVGAGTLEEWQRVFTFARLR